MNAALKPLEELVRELPRPAQEMVREFAESLLMQHRIDKDKKKLSQNWAAALRNYSDVYTALELQEKALEWRSES
ncbi:MAG: DUF2281 domain-containing protein [Chloroflexi bacterium]|nr:DUF2281 domain-containing protein [Chloroflexota bacterium]